MALNAHLRLKGQKQGDIKGAARQKGREGRIAVIAVSHEIVSPRDPASGQATGRRQHKPLVITKELDRSTPLLHAAHVNNEVITGFTLDFFSADQGSAGTGVEVNDYTITLENASIVGIHTVMPNTKDPDLIKRATYQEVSFTYEKITWTWNDGAITATDDFSAAT
jgi:type VI secretion system secreted protein Hcp